MDETSVAEVGTVTQLTGERLHIASAADSRYLPHLATLVESLAAAGHSGRCTFHLLSDGSIQGVELAALEALFDRYDVDHHVLTSPESALAGLPRGDRSRFPHIIWMRMLLPSLLEGEDRVLYLDADTIVLQDLSPLWATPLSDSLLGAVDHGPPGPDAEPRAARYFNSGVLLMNLEQMRRESFVDRLSAVGRALPADVGYPDQEAYNSASAGRWTALHPRWNTFAAWYLPGSPAGDVLQHPEIAEAVASPAILHFEGSGFAKPWNFRCVHPHREIYRMYRARTAWPLTHLDDGGLSSKALSRLPIRAQTGIALLSARVRSALQGR